MANLEFNPIEKTLDLVGNGGGGGAERLIVNVTYEAGTGYSADKTFAEIAAAVAADKIVVVRANSLEYAYSHSVTGTVGALSKHFFYETFDNKIRYLTIQSDESVVLEVLDVAIPCITTIPSDGNFNPNCLYVLDMSGTATLVMGLNAAAAGIAAKYHIFFKIGTTRPTITWPSLKGWADGEAPTIAASETAGYMHVYEVDFMEGYGYAKDWGEVEDA